MAKLPGLHARCGVYQLRVVIPLDLRPAYEGRTKLVHSLKTSDRREAALLGATRRATVLQEFHERRRALNPQPAAHLGADLGKVLGERLRTTILGSAGSLSSHADTSAALPHIDAEARRLGLVIHWQTPEAAPILQQCHDVYRSTLAEVRAGVADTAGPAPAAPRWKAASDPSAPGGLTLRQVFTRWAPSRPRKAASTRACELAVDLFEQQHGDIPVQQITRPMGDSFRTWLQQQDGSSKSARDRFTWVKTLLLYAHRDLEIIPRQPWAKLDIVYRTEAQRRVWAPDELRAFFGLPIFTAYRVPLTTQAGADAAYWIPLIGLYTGATVSELAQLRVQDVLASDDGASLRITDDGEGMTTKNAYRVRAVPVHSELVRLGFLEYVETIRWQGAERLWPRLKLRKDKPGGYFSEWFGQTRRAPPVSFGKYPDFHCLRHTVRTAMSEAGFDEAVKDRITGHTVRGSEGTKTYDHSTSILRAAVESIKYPGLVLPRVFKAPAWKPRNS